MAVLARDNLAGRAAIDAAASPVAVLVIGAAWLALVVHELEPPHGPHSLPAEVAAWTVMVAAMMGPVALPAIRHVALSSLRWRRSRAVTEFAVAYGGLWVAFGAVALAVTSQLGRSGRLAALVLVLAVLWQLTPVKQRFLRNCHRAVPLPPTGLRASLGCLRFAWVHGTACMGSCWCLMGVMAVAPSGHLLSSAVLTAVVLGERLAPKPRRTAREATVPLLALAVVLAFGG